MNCYIPKQPSQASHLSPVRKVLAGYREFFSKTCPAGKMTAVIEGGALTARDILRPVGANIRSSKPPRRAHDPGVPGKVARLFGVGVTSLQLC